MRNRKEALKELQQKIGYQFKDETLLKQALTHSSFANEQKINKLGNYERLEFLGDAVLELVSSEFLFNENKDMPEGQLTRLRASMVCERHWHTVQGISALAHTSCLARARSRQEEEKGTPLFPTSWRR